MEIRIDGKPADITLDNEKNIGEIMAGLEAWLGNSGYRLSGLSINGQAVNGSSSMEEIFTRDINSVQTLEIFTSSLAELTAESLQNLLADIKIFESMKFEERADFFENWKESSAANFTAEQMPDLYKIFVNSFSGGEINPQTAFSITEERLREVTAPLQEFLNLKPLLEETCTLLTDLPLDIQTGKDAKAAKTMQIFSGVSEKILRVFKQLNIQGFLSKKENNEDSFNVMLNEFLNLAKEILAAYEKHDTVLLGDLAEYEAAPMLNKLYTAILNYSSELKSSTRGA
ncbi:MAG: hypothetical protein LBI12_00330 [Treponema sp.]|nr:hypothetical protein [Treponema sp.]